MVIEDFSIELRAGEIAALVGDNGAGKSALVKIIAGDHAPTSASISCSEGGATSRHSSNVDVV